MQPKNPQIADCVLARFSYNPDTGEVFRDGSRVGTISQHGYRTVGLTTLNGHRAIMLHRLIWKLQTGEWPKNYVDHIDRNKLNNRWNNLRDVTHQQNQLNNSGKGYELTPAGNYKVRMRIGGKVKHIATAYTEADARRIYEEARAREFAKHGQA